MKYRLLGACVAAACCAAPAFAQGLSRVEILALQQQLRDDGCGVTHVTGRLDATTRAGVKKCESKYSGATDARSMLAAMHIGFENGNTDPSVSQARSGRSMNGMSSGMNSGNESMNAGANARARARMRGSMNGMRDSTRMHGNMNGMRDSTRMRGNMNGMRDSARMRGNMNGMRDSARMRRGRMRDSTMRHDTSMTRSSGGMVDTDKTTPMTPAAGSVNPVPSTNPSNPTPPSKPIP